MVTVATLLEEYGSALDESRELQRDLDFFADLARMGDLKPLSKMSTALYRDALNLCLAGGGHFRDKCTEECFE